MSTIPLDGSFAVPVSGPSQQLAWLRALWLKASGLATNAWAHTRVVLSGAVRLPRWVATATVSVLSSQAGYDAVVAAASTGVRSVAGGVSWAATRLRGGLCRVGDTAARLVGRVWPAAEAWLRATAARVATPVHDGVELLSGLLTGIGVVAEGLAGTPLVQSASTGAAKVAAGVLAVHAISSGAVAAKIVSVIPASVDLVVALTNPWFTLAGIGVVTAATMGIALTRLLSARPDVEPDVDGGGQHDTPPSGVSSPAVSPVAVQPTEPAVDPAEVDDVVTDLEQIAQSVHVVIATDGSVLVEGIPRSVPEELRQVVARIAADAAIRHVERTLKVRPTPSRDDRRLWTKAAREALVAEAKRRKRQHARPAA